MRAQILQVGIFSQFLRGIS